MSLYKFVRKAWTKPGRNKANHGRLMEFRRQPSLIRIERPTRIDRARALGYKAKEGFVVVRQRVLRGGHTRPRIRAGRRSKRFGMKKNLSASYRTIAEQRAARRFSNLEVLNSYWVASDATYYWYEIILVDPMHPVIRSDRKINWISEKQHTRRVYRGLTSSGKKSRN